MAGRIFLSKGLRDLVNDTFFVAVNNVKLIIQVDDTNGLKVPIVVPPVTLTSAGTVQFVYLPLTRLALLADTIYNLFELGLREGGSVILLHDGVVPDSNGKNYETSLLMAYLLYEDHLELPSFDSALRILSARGYSANHIPNFFMRELMSEDSFKIYCSDSSTSV